MRAVDEPLNERLQKLAEFRYQMRRFLSFSEAASDAAGVSVQQYQLLQVIAAVPAGRGATISYLAERMFLRHNSTVELVDRAVRAGWVQRETDVQDLRRSVVRLTPEGSAVMERLVREHLAEMDAHGYELVAAIEEVIESRRTKAAQ
jgi:DNA-binding MarR family transcriptional regulator